MPKISVIVPVHNDHQYLPAAIQSVLDQTFQDFEILVIDDGSKEEWRTGEIVASFNSPKIRLFANHFNQGVSATRNTGIENASGDYLVFLDADDLLEPRKLEIQSALLDKNPHIKMIYSDEYVFNDSEPPKREPVQFKDPCHAPSGDILHHFIHRSFIAIFTVMVRRSIVAELKGFDQNLNYDEDDDLFLKIIAHNDVLFSDYTSGSRRLHSGNESANRAKMTQGKYASLINFMFENPKLYKLHNDDFIYRKRKVMKSYLKYCYYERHIPWPSIFLQYFTLIKKTS